MTIAKSSREASMHEWRHVPVGAVVQLKSGVWWITGHDGPLVTMVHTREGRETTGSPPPGALVRVLQPGDTMYVSPPEQAAAQAATAGLSEPAQAQLAQALVQIMLGGHVIAERDLDVPDAPAVAPAVAGLTDRHLAAHLYLFHDLSGVDSFDLAAPPPRDVLVALHDSRRTSTPHVHKHTP